MNSVMVPKNIPMSRHVITFLNSVAIGSNNSKRYDKPVVTCYIMFKESLRYVAMHHGSDNYHDDDIDENASYDALCYRENVLIYAEAWNSQAHFS